MKIEKQNTKCLIREDVYENIVCEMAAILSKGRWEEIPLIYGERGIPFLVTSLGQQQLSDGSYYIDAIKENDK